MLTTTKKKDNKKLKTWKISLINNNNKNPGFLFALDLVYKST